MRGLDEIPRGKPFEEWVGLRPFSSAKFVCGELQVFFFYFLNCLFLKFITHIIIS